MKRSIAALAFFSVLAANAAWSVVWAQAPDPGSAATQPSVYGGAGAMMGPPESRVLPPGATVPTLTPVDQLKAPTIPLPHEPVEGYLLTKDVGPFMVLARVFRGVDSEQLALVLVKELRDEYKLPAYILRTKDFPGRSLMRGTPPTVPSQVMQPSIKMPEKIRTFDEAAVLVGNEKTLADQEKLWNAVKKLNPKCLQGMSTPFPWRTGLRQALRTTNPYVPAQYLYPRTRDRLMVKINSGLRSIANCPGRYSLQVAEFSGRSAFQLDPLQPAGQILPPLKTSPLMTAQDDAEKLADKLTRSPEIQQLGLPVYVFHDRTASRVYIGSFNDLQDPAVYKAREAALRLASIVVDTNTRNRQNTKKTLDDRLVPASALTDLSGYKKNLQN
jgi:hypothetical protein